VDAKLLLQCFLRLKFYAYFNGGGGGGVGGGGDDDDDDDDKVKTSNVLEC
jgi:hypothetical protein